MGSHCGGLLSADQRCNEVVECRAGANLVISMRGRSTDLPIREQLPGHTFSQHEKFHGFSKEHFSIIESDLFLAPLFINLRFDGVDLNHFGKFLISLADTYYSILLV